MAIPAGMFKPSEPRQLRFFVLRAKQASGQWSRTYTGWFPDEPAARKAAVQVSYVEGGDGRQFEIRAGSDEDAIMAGDPMNDRAQFYEAGIPWM